MYLSFAPSLYLFCPVLPPVPTGEHLPLSLHHCEACSEQVSSVKRSVSLLLFFLSFFPSLNLFFLVSGPCIYPLGLKPLEPLYRGRKNACHIKSHCITDWIYTIAPVGELQRQNTNTCPFQFPSNKKLSYTAAV